MNVLATWAALGIAASLSDEIRDPVAGSRRALAAEITLPVLARYFRFMDYQS